MRTSTINDINEYVGSTVNPINTPETEYELYSVTSFDTNSPDIIKAADIGSSKVTVEENDILICMINPRMNRVWVVKHYTKNQLIASSEWVIVRSSQNDSNYLNYYFQSPVFRNYINSELTGIGGSLTRAQPKNIAKYPVPLPDLETQHQIAANLDKVTHTIDLCNAILEKLDLLVKSRFVEMFGEFIKTSTPVDFESICQFVSVGIANSATHAFCDNGIIMFRNQNIKEDYLDDSDIVYIKREFAEKYKNKKLEKDDLIIVRTGYPGIACLVPEKYAGSQTFTTLIARLKKNCEITPRFICHFINSKYGKKYVLDNSAGAAQQNFGATALSKMPVYLPPIELQNKYIKFVEQTDKSKLAVKKLLEKAETLKKALMQEYFG